MSYLDCGILEPVDNTGLCLELVGGNDAIIFVARGETFDTQSEIEVQALIDTGKAAMITNITAEIPVRSPIRVDSNVACEPQTVINYTHTATWRHGVVSQLNNDFYDSLDRTSGFKVGTIIIKSCSNGKQYVCNGKHVIYGGLLNPYSDEALQEYNYTSEWKSRTLPIIEDANPIFNS